jgi:hypothetical protein
VRTYHAYHFPAERLAFSEDKTKITKCVLINFPSLLFPAERMSFSAEAEAILMDIGLTGEEAMTKALCVSILHIMVIISRLRGSPLVRTR